MLYLPISEVVDWLYEISMRPCDFTRDDFDESKTEDLANNAIEYLNQLHEMMESKKRYQKMNNTHERTLPTEKGD